MYVSLLLDVEDIIDPESDDIARTIGEIIASESIRATFCVVGERARQWRDRGRTDVVEALKQHDIGYHTDLHSVHPTVVEYLADKGWEDGVEEALRRDRPGADAIQRVFGVTPSCWGGPGNTWGPQINEAMRRLGVPAVVYAHTRVPEGDVHRFCDVLAYPDGPAVGDDCYQDTPLWNTRMESLLKRLSALHESGRQWSQVFVGHPSRILHEEFWDGPNFSHGRNPARANWVVPRRKDDRDLSNALDNLRATLRSLKRLPGIEICTIREMNARLGSSPADSLSDDEIGSVAAHIDRDLAAMAGWVILPPDVDTRRIRALTREKLPTLRRLTLGAGA